MRGLSRATLISLLSLSSHALAPQTRTFDPKKLIRTGSVTTYWKLVEVSARAREMAK